MGKLSINKLGRREIYLVKGPRECGKTRYIQAEEKKSPLKWLWTTEEKLRRPLDSVLEDIDVLVIQESEWSSELYARLKVLVTEKSLSITARNRGARVIKNKISKIFVEVPA